MVKQPNALDLNGLLESDVRAEERRFLFDIVARHSWWISPNVYREIPVVYPLTRRKRGISEKRGDVVNGIRLWTNEPAQKAFWMGLGKDPREVANFYVCHIYE